MKIKLNGMATFLDSSVYFNDLDVDIYSDEEYVLEGLEDDSLYDELVTLDDYLVGMIEDYTEILECTDADTEEVLAMMIFELLGIGL